MRLPSGPLPEFADLSQHEVTVDGHRIAYVEAGHGEPVLLLHGAVFSGNSFMWELAADMAPSARAIAPDLPGWGASDKPSAPYTIAYYHRFIDGFLEALGLAQVTLVAHSLGGLIGTSYALHHPARVAGLAVLSVPPPWIDIPVPRLFWPFLVPMLGELSLLLTPALGLDHPMGIRRHYEALFHDATRISAPRLRQILLDCCRTLDDPAHRQAVLSTFRSNQLHFGWGGFGPYRQLLSEVCFPLWLIAGRDDPLFDRELFCAAQRAYPDAHLTLLDDCGHFPMWEQPERLAELLQGLLEAASPVVSGPSIRQSPPS